MSVLVWVFGRRHDEAVHALGGRRPKSEGTKSREVWHPAVQRVLWGSYVGCDLDWWTRRQHEATCIALWWGRCDSPHQGAGPQMTLAVLDHALHADNT
jgi:hypothetical protein